MKDVYRDIIAEGFIKLCKEIPFKNLKVKDIYTYCQVSKQTFYNYFRDKYDVMRYIYIKDAHAIIQALNCTSQLDVYRAIKNMLDTCLEHREYYVSVGKFIGQNDFFDVFLQDALQFYTSLILRITKAPPTPEIRFAIAFNCYGVAHMFVNWILNGMQEPTEFIAQNAAECIPYQLRCLLESPQI